MSKKFYAAGLNFECQGSGKCCMSRGKYGYVYLTLSDRRRFAKHFKLTVAAFTKLHCTKTDGYWHLNHPDRDCGFLVEKRCSVYEARPLQCRTWPFWPENMQARAWKSEVESFCPGVGKGRLFPATEIESIVKSNGKS